MIRVVPHLLIIRLCEQHLGAFVITAEMSLSRGIRVRLVPHSRLC
jgi:hypothetical protein